MQCARLVSNARHGRALRSIWRLLLSGVKRKEHLVWLYGLASCGKSEFIRRVRGIFASAEVDWSGPYMPERERNLPLLKE